MYRQVSVHGRSARVSAILHLVDTLSYKYQQYCILSIPYHTSICNTASCRYLIIQVSAGINYTCTSVMAGLHHKKCAFFCMLFFCSLFFSYCQLTPNLVLLFCSLFFLFAVFMIVVFQLLSTHTKNLLFLCSLFFCSLFSAKNQTH